MCLFVPLRIMNIYFRQIAFVFVCLFFCKAVWLIFLGNVWYFKYNVADECLLKMCSYDFFDIWFNDKLITCERFKGHKNLTLQNWVFFFSFSHFQIILLINKCFIESIKEHIFFLFPDRSAKSPVSATIIRIQKLQLQLQHQSIQPLEK